MNFAIPLLGLAIYLLFWDKLPSWGTWFMWIIDHLPRPLRYLYKKWNCAYCSGFWVGLALHGIMGQWFITDLATLPSFWEPVDLYIGWFLDALGVGTVVLVMKMLLDVLKAHR